MFREFGKRGWERILLAKTEVYFRRETSNGRQKEEKEKKEEEEEESSYEEKLSISIRDRGQIFFANFPPSID